MRLIIALAVGIAVPSPEAFAQAVPDKGDPTDVICVGGHAWQPAPAETPKIESSPVPESFRRRLESKGPCVRWEMRFDKGIIDWHLHFGSAESVAKALRYIEENDPEIPSPEKYLPTLRRSLAAALPDLKRAAALKQPPSLSYSVSRRYIEQSKSITPLRKLLRVQDDYVFRATNFLRSAEEFSDPALLAKTEKYVETLDATAVLLAQVTDFPTMRETIDFVQFDIDDVRARAALLRSQISESDADLARAETILNSQERPIDKALADSAYSGGDDFCDISDGVTNKEAIEEACHDDEVDERVTTYAVNRAQYESLRAAIDGKQPEDYYSSWTYLAERLLALQSLPKLGRCCSRTADEDRLRLWMTRADQGARKIFKTPHSSADWKNGNGPVRLRYDTLSLLMQAERLAPPYSAPTRFTRIATQWLRVWKARPAETVEGDAGFNPVTDGEHARVAAYFTTVLHHLANRADEAVSR